MMREVGFCSGIENYSRFLDGRAAGQAPYTLLDYFPDDFLCVLDESHVTIPQLHGQFEGDRSAQGHAGRARVPAAVGDGQPAAALRGVRREDQPGRLHVGDAERLRAEGVEAGGRADRPPDRADGPRGRGAPDQGPDRRSRRRDQPAGRERPAGAGHHAHEEDVRGPDRLPARARDPGPVPAQRGGHARAGGAAPVAAARRVRRARRHQPAPGGPRPARGLARVDPRRGQGRVPPVRDEPHPDDRARRRGTSTVRS